MIDSVYLAYFNMVVRQHKYTCLEEILADLANECRNVVWINRYIRFIKTRKNKPIKGITEKHHILPKCLFQDKIFGGVNIINLTHREHFIAHLLLLMCCPDNFKLKCAVYSMCPKYKGSSSRIYESLKKNIAEEISNKQTVLLNSIQKEEYRLRCKRAWETRRRNGTDKQSVNLTPEGRQRLKEKGAARKGEKRSIESRRNISIAHIGLKDSEETRKRKRESAKRAWILRKK
jgi:hypothetical protein